MKKTLIAGAVAAVGLSLSAGSLARADWMYVDIVPTTATVKGNTVDAADPSRDWTLASDGTSPGSSSNDGWQPQSGVTAPPVDQGTRYCGMLYNYGASNGNDPNLVTTITGLQPNTKYDIHFYGTFAKSPQGNAGGFSTDGGQTYQIVDDYNQAGSGGYAPFQWVDDSNSGVGTTITPNPNGDNRYEADLNALTMTTDANGNGKIWTLLTDPNTGASLGGVIGNDKKFFIDGFAVQARAVATPEPASLALLGIGGLGLLRRRRRPS